MMSCVSRASWGRNHHFPWEKVMRSSCIVETGERVLGGRGTVEMGESWVDKLGMKVPLYAAYRS